MWHEARKQEKKIRGMLVDYKRRAERRKEYYERIKQDPTQFIQIHGRACKIHLDPAIHNAAEAPGSMMPWRGDLESMIDRFDVRAHLDDIPTFDRASVGNLTKEQLWEERQANYERYRILVQNEFLGVKEEKFLNQIRLEELYGPVSNKSIEDEKRALLPRKAAIGFVYGEPPAGEPLQGWSQGPPPAAEDAEEDSADDSDSDIDLDLTVDVLSLTNEQQQELNLSGVEYGLNPEDFMDLMSRDLEEAEALRIAKEHEDEKAMYSGRKSRKERRALKKKHLDRKLSPPSYAARSSPTYGPYHRLSSKSHSKSPSPPCGTSQIKFITFFGDESEGPQSEGEGGVILIPEGGNKASASSSERRKNSATSSSSRSSARRSKHSRRSSTCSRERSQSRTVSHRRQSSSRRSRSRTPSRSSRRERHAGRYRRRSSRSYSKSRSRSVEWERSRRRRHGKSGSRSYSRSRSRSRSRSKSSSYRKDQRSSPKIRKASQGHPAPLQEEASSPPDLPSPPRRRYYGRRSENSDSEDAESGGEDGARNNGSPMNHPQEESSWSLNSLSIPSSFGNDSTVDKNSSSAAAAAVKLTPQERLKKKMQALLKKQYKADKKLEKERAVKAEQERQDREEELREIAIKLRRREREKRHRLHGEDSNSEDSARSRSPSKSPPPPPVSSNRGRAEGRHRDREAGYEREPLDKEADRSSSRPKERGREREAREPELKKYSHRSRSRERERHKDRGRERYKAKDWSSEREPRRGREEGLERHREDSYRERDAGRMRTHPTSSKGYGVGSYALSREDRPHPRIWDNPPVHSQSEDYLSSSESRKVRLVDY